ncbi:unnamed protein product [Closterium sp. NIES-53]
MMARVVKCMQTAQWCAQKDAPVVLYPDLARFMAMQGCPDMVNYEAYGRYYSRYAFGEFTEVLAQHLSDQQLQDIKPSAWYGLSFDESTDRARGKHLIIYIMFERNEEVVNQFFGHLTLEKCDAVSIYNAILSFLHSKDLSLNMLVGVSTDGASVMTGSKGGVVALLRKRCPWLVAVHCVAHRESLAAKDAAESFKEFNVIDQLIRQTAERLGRSSVNHNSFMHLQDVIMKTQLEVQGIFAVRWLSRGDAVQRFCDVLPVLLWMWQKENKATLKIATSFKFQFMLFLLADVLHLLNGLNLAFQKSKVNITEVKNHIDKVKTKLAQWYVEPSASLGAKTRLAAFVAIHGDKDKREIIIKGADDDGSPARATIQLHEESIGAGGNDLDACYDLAKRFAQRLINTLGKRMADLRHFDGVLFFQPHEYPPRLGEREAWLKFHMSELLDMFHNQLPGVSAEDIEPQMHLFTATLDKKFKHQSFNQALTNMLRTSDWKDDYPTLVSLWRAISVLPLSTVECERGFSRQNIIKSWDRVALSDVRLGELMTVKMLDYAVDWAAAYAIFESKGRKTA